MSFRLVRVLKRIYLQYRRLNNSETHVGCAWHVQLELDEVTILAQEEILGGFGVHFSQGGAELIFPPTKFVP